MAGYFGKWNTITFSLLDDVGHGLQRVSVIVFPRFGL